jgi:hypothetical protein
MRIVLFRRHSMYPFSVILYAGGDSSDSQGGARIDFWPVQSMREVSLDV